MIKGVHFWDARDGSKLEFLLIYYYPTSKLKEKSYLITSINDKRLFCKVECPFLV